MGGYNSGRPPRYTTMEQRLRLDIRTFRRRGWLAGHGGTLRWSTDGEETASMGYLVGDDGLRLRWQTKDDDGNPLPIQITVPITTIPCRFGGHRRYWRCPRCGGRCEVLAIGWGGRGVACRRCLHLRYACQRLGAADRMQRRAHKILERLGAIDPSEPESAVKPKWMRWRTFDRLVAQAHDFDNAADRMFAVACIARFGLLPDDLAASLGVSGTRG